MRRPRVAVAGFLVAFVLSGPAAAALPVEPELRLDPPSDGLLPQEEHEVVGSGFLLPPVDRCELTWDGEAAGGRCVVDDGVQGALDVPGDADPSLTHEVGVCVPDCRHPWAGSATTSVLLRTPEPSDDPVVDSPADSPAVDPTTTAPVVLRAPGRVRGAAASGAAGTSAPGLDVLNEPDPSPGDTLRVASASLPVPNDGCVLLWEAEPLGSCRAGQAGDLTGSLVVPATATEGSYVVTACRPTCNAPVGGSGSVVVTVLAATVPDPAEEPGAGEDPAPDVPVPDLEGLTLEQASDLLQASGLGLGEAVGSGRVTGQDPAAGALRGPGTRVDVALSDVTAPPTVEVPLVVGGTVAEAAATLAAAGLGTAGVPEGTSPDAQVVAQSPEAGTLVDKGSLVGIELLTAPTTGPARWLLGLLVAALALAVGTVASLVRSAVGQHTTASPAAELVPVADLAPEVVAQVRTGARPAPGLQLAARPDTRPHVTTEVVVR